MSAIDYVTAIKALDVKVLAEADLGYYQGDWVGLVRNESYAYSAEDKVFGFLVVGYGSCSGCDAWQAEPDPAARADLIAKILRDGKWFAELNDAKAYIADVDARKLDWYGNEDDYAEFVTAALKASEW